LVLDEGESLAGLVGEVPDWCEVHESEGFVVAQRPYETFYYDVDVYSADAAGRRLTAQAIEPATRTLTAAAWKSIPSSYVLCEKDAAVPPPLQETMAGHTGEVVRLDTGHSPFLARPAELAALLRQLASG
jgi:pimeloyl-ACP methyl ester carboxylesterase